MGLRGSHKGYLGGNIPNWLILYLHVNGPCGNSTLPTCHLHILNDYLLTGFFYSHLLVLKRKIYPTTILMYFDEITS